MPPALPSVPWRMSLFVCLTLSPLLGAQVPSFVSGAAYPPKVVLHHAHDRQQLLISGQTADGSTQDATRGVSYSSRDPKIAVADAAGVVRPKTKGTTAI